MHTLSMENHIIGIKYSGAETLPLSRLPAHRQSEESGLLGRDSVVVLREHSKSLPSSAEPCFNNFSLYEIYP